MRKGIFIAATGQNVGKTTCCLGLIAALKKRFNRVGFIKPVGQQHVEITPGLIVDKDVQLFQEVFDLEDDWKEMSPVIIPSGFTRKFLDKEITSESLKESIVRSYEAISSRSDFTIVEGTGHVGVGSILELGNAEVARMLDLEMILIATAGLGSTFDELTTYIELAHRKGAKVRGVILNRVQPEKREMVQNYMQKALDRYSIPLLGTIPYNAFLNTPTMSDFAAYLKAPLITGQENALRHFKHKRLVASSLRAFLEEERKEELIITPASRSDIIAAVIEMEREDHRSCGMILTGSQPPDEETYRRIYESDIPIIYVPLCSYDAMKKITSFIAKIRREDHSKVKKAIELVEEEILLDPLIRELDHA